MAKPRRIRIQARACVFLAVSAKQGGGSSALLSPESRIKGGALLPSRVWYRLSTLLLGDANGFGDVIQAAGLGVGRHTSADDPAGGSGQCAARVRERCERLIDVVRWR